MSEDLKVEMLALTGKAIERDVLTAVEVIPENETQQHLWSTYKKDVKYQWYSLSSLPKFTYLVLLINQWFCRRLESGVLSYL